MAAFHELDEHALSESAASIRETFAKFYIGLNDPDFSGRLNTAHARNQYYHWWCSIVPRFGSRTDNLEGKLRTSPVLPERAAEFLRSTRVEQAISA